MDRETWIPVAIGAGVILLIAFAVWRERRRPPPPEPDPMIAVIDEQLRYTTDARACMVLLVLFNLIMLASVWIGAVLAFSVAGTNAILIWIGLNGLLCAGIALGRRRRYIVRQRPAHRDPPRRQEPRME